MVVFFGMTGDEPAQADPNYLVDTSKTLTGGQLTANIGATFLLAGGAALYRLLESRLS